jgi:hypothetical protein
LMNVALEYRDRIDPAVMLPQINWRQPRNERRVRTSRDPMRLSEDSLATVGDSAGKNNGKRRTARRARAAS